MSICQPDLISQLDFFLAPDAHADSLAVLVLKAQDVSVQVRAMALQSLADFDLGGSPIMQVRTLRPGNKLIYPKRDWLICCSEVAKYHQLAVLGYTQRSCAACKMQCRIVTLGLLSVHARAA